MISLSRRKILFSIINDESLLCPKCNNTGITRESIHHYGIKCVLCKKILQPEDIWSEVVLEKQKKYYKCLKCHSVRICVYKGQNKMLCTVCQIFYTLDGCEITLQEFDTINDAKDEQTKKDLTPTERMDEMKSHLQELNFYGTSSRSKGWDLMRVDLLSFHFLKRIGVAAAEGCFTHGPHNWKQGMPKWVIKKHIVGHFVLWMCNDTKEDHLAKVGWGIMAYIHYEETNTGDGVEAKPDITWEEANKNDNNNQV